MLNQERTEDPAESLRLALFGWQSEIWTTLPAILDSFDKDKMTCVVQPTIKGKWRDKTGAITDVQLPQCLDVPVQFPSGGGYTLTFPLKQGDEGIVLFSSRCIDAWWQSGGVQNQAEVRMHSLSDGMFIPKIWSQPKVLSDIDPDNVQLRADDGSSLIEISESQIRMKHPTKVLVDSPTVEFTGDVSIDGKLTSGDTTSLGGGAQAVKLADGSNATKVKAT